MIIVNNNSGQLCNKLILFAHAYATAIDTHQKVYHLYWFYSRHLFRESCRTDIGFFPGRLGIFYRYYDKYVTSKRSQRYDYAARMEMQSRIRGQILAKGVHRLYVIDAWEYRDYDALFRHRDIIVSVFRPTAETEDAVERFWDSLPREDNTVIVGIHMRRGDYRVWNDGVFYYSDDVYQNWMEDLAKSTTRNVHFLLCSNEEFDLANFKSEAYTVSKAPGTQLGDLYSLAKCDYIMGPPSTYSWWAAFYGNRKYLTLYSSDMRVSMENFQDIRGEEFIPPVIQKMGDHRQALGGRQSTLERGSLF